MNSLMIVCGAPASGKSTYAKKLAGQKAAILLDSDTCTETLIKIALQESGRDPYDRDSDYFKEQYREAVYETVFLIAEENLPNNNVIIVGPFTKEIQKRDWPLNLEKRFQVKPVFYYMWCNPDNRKIRMAARSNRRDLHKLEEWDRHASYYQKMARPCFDHIYIDSSD